VLDGTAFESVLAEMPYLDFRLYLEENLLVKVDRASMACSLEMRTPFLDHRLIEFAAGLPGDLKVRGFEMKHLLKKAAEQWLPRKIVYRQKRGFSVPISRWMRKELRPWLDQALGEERLRRQGDVQRPVRAPASRRTLERAGGPPESTLGPVLFPALVRALGWVGARRRLAPTIIAYAHSVA
jgi:asparagine synthase (glutamine-hydrolysing)